VTLDEKTGMYSALGVHAYIEHIINEYQTQWGILPQKIILGSLEWKLIGFDFNDENYIKDVLISLNQNVESATVIVGEK
jgi:hypothetical protein